MQRTDPDRRQAWVLLRTLVIPVLVVLASLLAGEFGGTPATAAQCDVTWRSDTTYLIDEAGEIVTIDSVAVPNLEEWFSDCPGPYLEFPVVPGARSLTVETAASFELSVETDANDELSSYATIEFQADTVALLTNGVRVRYETPADGDWVVFDGVSASFPIWATGEDDGAAATVVAGETDAIISSVAAVDGESAVGRATFTWDADIYPNHNAIVYFGNYERTSFKNDIVYFSDDDARDPDPAIIDGTVDGYFAVVDLLGDRPNPDLPITIVEIPVGSLNGYAGEYDALFELIEIDADLDQATLYHELAHAWFKDDIFSDPWLSEGLAEYTAITLENELPDTDGYLPLEVEYIPPADEPLMDWDIEELSSSEAQDRVDYGYTASTYVIDSVASEVGSDEMFGLVATLIETAAITGDPITSRGFLDAFVAELGYTDSNDVFDTYVFGPGAANSADQPTTTQVPATTSPASTPETVEAQATGPFDAGAGVWALVGVLFLAVLILLMALRRSTRPPEPPPLDRLDPDPFPDDRSDWYPDEDDPGPHLPG